MEKTIVERLRALRDAGVTHLGRDGNRVTIDILVSQAEFCARGEVEDVEFTESVGQAKTVTEDELNQMALPLDDTRTIEEGDTTQEEIAEASDGEETTDARTD